jgi:glycosyltransferase involved in cell wall biosynthesis
MNDKLRITFIIPATAKTGGIAVILEYYRQLTAMGHDVNLVYPLFPYRQILYHESLRPAWRKAYLTLRHFQANVARYARSIPHFSEDIPVTPVLAVNGRSIPDADAVIATAWPTAYSVARLPPEKGRKFYFVQGYETWHGQEEKVDASYRLPLSIITIAPWLSELLREKFGRDVTEIRNGVRLDKFYPPAAKDFGRMSILTMAHAQELKGTQDAIEALAAVKERYPQLKIAMFGMCPRPPAPFDFEYHRDPPYEKLLSLYQNAAIFISPSHKEGWHLPPMEAMACQCALVATNVGCVPALDNGKNLILVEAKNPASIADGVVRLLEDRTLAESVAAEGLKRVSEQEWPKAAQALVSALRVQ